MRIRLTTTVSILLIFLGAKTALSCTAFYLPGDRAPVVGTNFDWHAGQGMIMVNKRGNLKTAMHDPTKVTNPARWKSAQGSVTFNQYGCDWAWSGMNEAGLVGATLILDESRFPVPDQRPSVHLCQWLQYQLDNFSRVTAVIAGDTHLRIRPVAKGLRAHFFFSDASGDSAVIEFIDGRMASYHKEALPVRALTNTSYPILLNTRHKLKKGNDTDEALRGNLSYLRFLRVTAALSRYRQDPDRSSRDYAFGVLESAAYIGHRTIQTQWRIVYDPINRIIHYKTRQSPGLKSIDMNRLDFSCATPVKMLDIDAVFDDSPYRRFEDLTCKKNRRLFERAFAVNPFRHQIRQARLDRMASYPETFECQWYSQ